MKKMIIGLIILTVLLVGCQQKIFEEDIPNNKPICQDECTKNTCMGTDFVECVQYGNCKKEDKN